MSRKIIIMAATLAILLMLSLLEQTIVLRITNNALENAQMVIDAGADVLVIGTGLFRAKDPKAVVKTVMKAAEGK